MFASKSTRGFYDVTIHATMPNDVVEISNDLHAELMAGQSEGKIIAWDDDGYPVLVDPPPSTPKMLAVIERQWRDERLWVTDGVVTRHRDEIEVGIAPTLTVEQYAELQVYRRQLREWPQGDDFPLADHRPAAPAWLADQLQ